MLHPSYWIVTTAENAAEWGRGGECLLEDKPLLSPQWGVSPGPLPRSPLARTSGLSAGTDQAIAGLALNKNGADNQPRGRTVDRRAFGRQPGQFTAGERRKESWGRSLPHPTPRRLLAVTYRRGRVERSWRVCVWGNSPQGWTAFNSRCRVGLVCRWNWGQDARSLVGIQEFPGSDSGVEGSGASGAMLEPGQMGLVAAAPSKLCGCLHCLFALGWVGTMGAGRIWSRLYWLIAAGLLDDGAIW